MLNKGIPVSHRIIEWDLSLISHIEELKTSATMLQNAISSDDKQSMRQEMGHMNEKLQGFMEVFEKRREAIAGLGVE
jgi:septation ring formation regulator EzrA